MDLPEPTTLHHDLAPVAPVPATTQLAWGAVMVPILIMISWYTLHRRRVANMPRDERAFHALAKRMGLRAAQMRAVRVYAREVAHVAPITVLMNAQMNQAALGLAVK